MMAVNKRRSVRFDEHTWMILNEISRMTGAKMSVVIRSLIIKGINEITDESGNLKLNEKQVQKE